jgi:hypothetical protein
MYHLMLESLSDIYLAYMYRQIIFWWNILVCFICGYLKRTKLLAGHPFRVGLIPHYFVQKINSTFTAMLIAERVFVLLFKDFKCCIRCCFCTFPIQYACLSHSGVRYVVCSSPRFRIRKFVTICYKIYRRQIPCRDVYT